MSVLIRFVFRRSVALSMLAIGLCMGLCVGAALVNAEPGPGTWADERPLPALRAEVAATVVLGQLHAFGGALNNVSETAHDAYDPVTKMWRARAPLPEARDHLAVVEAGGKIFAFGGFATPVHKGASTDSFEYDPS